MHPDEEVINAVLAGQRDDYAKLVERYAGDTHALAFSYLKDTQTAEDIAQEAFVKAYTALRVLVSPKVYGAWLAQITRNLCRAALRRCPPRTVPLSNADSIPHPTSPDPAAQAADRQVGEVLLEALDRLPPKLREAVTLFYLKEQSVREIAEFLGTSENTIKVRLHRARAALREHLDDTLKEGLAGIKPSKRFTSTVMALVPVQPAHAGWAAKGLAKLASTLMFIPCLGSILIATDVLVALTFLADVNPPYRRSQMKILMYTLYVSVIMLLLLTAAELLIQDHPWLAVSFWLLPFGLIFPIFKHLSLMLPTWQSRVGLIALVVSVTLLCIQFIQPYRRDMLLWALLAGNVCCLSIARSTLSAMRAPQKFEDEEPSSIGPVSMQYLQKHAMRFARILNTPVPHISSVKIERDCIRFATSIPRMFFWLPWLNNFEARLFPDGRVEADLQEPCNLPPHAAPPEECRSRIQDWIRRKWAYYLAGDLKKARSVRLSFLQSDFFKTRRGAFRFRYFYIALLISMVWLLGWQFHNRYIVSPTLTPSKLRHFYENEFLSRHQPEGDSTLDRMALHYRQPPSMMDIPGVAEAYLGLQKKWTYTTAESSIVHGSRQLVNGLEAGYLTLPILESWGLTRNVLASKNGRQPEWAMFNPKTLSGEQKLQQQEVKDIAARVRLLSALKLLDLMDSHLPDEIIKRLTYRDGAFCIPDEWWGELNTTCLVACILNLFDRWDLADRQATRRWILGYPSQHSYLLSADDLYHLGVGIIATGADDELPLTKLASFYRPRVDASRNSPWSIDPYDIDGFAVCDILSTGRLLELQQVKSYRHMP